MKASLKKYWNLYLSLILLVLGMFYYARAYAYEPYIYECEGNIYVFEHPLAIKNIQMYQNSHQQLALNYKNCKSNAQKVKFHKENGDSCYNDAKEKCWWLPNVSDRDKARYCFTNIGVLCSPGKSKSKLIIALVTTLIQYGLDCSSEWHYINNKLYCSQYHYEMMEFHQNLIKQEYP